MDLGMAQMFSDATWMNIDIWHIEFTFAHGIILLMALHTISHKERCKKLSTTSHKWLKIQNLTLVVIMMLNKIKIVSHSPKPV